MARRRLLALADGTTAFPTITVTGNSPQVDFQGGNGTLFVTGGFGGGTCTLQLLAPDGATWLSLGTGTVLTAAGLGGFICPAGQMRLNVAGAAAATIQAWVVGIPVNNGG